MERDTSSTVRTPSRNRHTKSSAKPTPSPRPGPKRSRKDCFPRAESKSSRSRPTKPRNSTLTTGLASIPRNTHQTTSRTPSASAPITGSKSRLTLSAAFATGILYAEPISIFAETSTIPLRSSHSSRGEEGLEKTLRELVDSTVQAINDFRPGYNEVWTELDRHRNLDDEELLKHFDGKSTFRDFRATWTEEDKSLFCRLARAAHRGGLDLWHVNIDIEVRCGRRNPGAGSAVGVLATIHGRAPRGQSNFDSLSVPLP